MIASLDWLALALNRCQKHALLMTTAGMKPPPTPKSVAIGCGGFYRSVLLPIFSNRSQSSLLIKVSSKRVCRHHGSNSYARLPTLRVWTIVCQKASRTVQNIILSSSSSPFPPPLPVWMVSVVQFMGQWPTLSALATLAFSAESPARCAYFQRELVNALRVVETRRVGRDDMTGDAAHVDTVFLG